MKHEFSVYVLKSTIDESTCSVAADCEERALSDISAHWIGTHKPIVASIDRIAYSDAERIASILPHLPGEWDASPLSKDYAQTNWLLRRSDGLEIFTASGRTLAPRGKVRFSYSRPRTSYGEYPSCVRDKNGNRVSNPSINCVETKTGEQLARDIAKRLLPESERVHALVMAHNAQAESYEAKCQLARDAASRCNGLGLGNYDVGFDGTRGTYVRISADVAPQYAEEFARIALEFSKKGKA